MSELLVVGSLAFDSVETPAGKRDRTLGGSANYFSISSSFFTDVKVVGVVGADFPESHIEWLGSRGIDTEGIQRQEGETFHWTGYYGEDLNEAHTLETRLNVFEHFAPEIPESYRNCKTVFLANIDPELQLQVLDQVKEPKLVACDTMNFWISCKREALLKVLERVDIFFSNEQELRDLSGEKNLLSAASWVRSYGPRVVVAKLGEYGAMVFHDGHTFWAPAFPLEMVKDPTGAGDTFGGGVMGYLAQNGGEFNAEDLHRAMVAGSVMASFNVEQFSFERMHTLSNDEIQTRFKAMHRLTHFSGTKLPLR
jgi:sugar/nucleoside kinase (ribokinase family)